MDMDSLEIVNDIRGREILHWNCRGLQELPLIIKDYGKHIQEIYLKWNQLTTLPSWIIELFNVTNLYLYGNFIRELPTELGKMIQLTVLDLSGNRLQELPSSIGNLINLKSLLLNDNMLQNLPYEMNKLISLEIFSISGNLLIALPEWIGSLPKLIELNIDNNRLKELPNRLTMASSLSLISVCSNRLKYLPLNAFVSSPLIKFDANEYLNYLSYPLLLQLVTKFQTLVIRNSRNILAYGCFKMSSENETLSMNIKLCVELQTSGIKDNDVVIVLPRQLLKVNNMQENNVTSLWELALRKAYKMRQNHTLNIQTAPLEVTVNCEPPIHKLGSSFTISAISFASYNLLSNGPISLCVNFPCQQPIFTEAWIIIGLCRYAYSITIALCCCKRCATTFVDNPDWIVTLHWHCVN